MAILYMIKSMSCGHIQKVGNKALRETSVVSELTPSEPIICGKCNTVYESNSEYLMHYNEKHKSEEKGKAKAMK
jgi:uncharacterized C2H2 Zn-finger protein